MKTLSIELLHTYATSIESIELEMDVESIKMDVNTAIPLGLISNELITNCFKHAFPGGQKGKVQIDLHKNNSLCEMIVRDDGVGFPEEIDFCNTTSLGLQVVNSLTSQIDGSIDLDNINGTEFKITFKNSNK
ncbi:sensor histidine kinase [Methanobacterium sp.]|uniref:sensor histidine kinase n=2 Tax=Methanobacterium sp. TaxID=2164 RepID=UPI00345843D3